MEEGKLATYNSRWNPSEKHLQILESLFVNGMRTPTPQEIENIAKLLKPYGKIEPKNVFYWFQNHKMREHNKQKRPTNTNEMMMVLQGKLLTKQLQKHPSVAQQNKQLLVESSAFPSVIRRVSTSNKGTHGSPLETRMKNLPEVAVSFHGASSASSSSHSLSVAQASINLRNANTVIGTDLLVLQNDLKFRGANTASFNSLAICHLGLSLSCTRYSSAKNSGDGQTGFIFQRGDSGSNDQSTSNVKDLENTEVLHEDTSAHYNDMKELLLFPLHPEGLGVKKRRNF